MNREQIIALAQLCDLGRVCGPLGTLLDHEWEDLHRFAALVAAHERELMTDAAMKAAEKAIDVAITAEREECARICEMVNEKCQIQFAAVYRCADDIRARVTEK